jgi:hypothetical protein
MLEEFTKVRQEKGGWRRLFCGEKHDLYVWYTQDRSTIIGFQLVYSLGTEQKALTWTEAEGYLHSGIDGWDSSRFNKTPLLVSDGVADTAALIRELRAEGAEVPFSILDLVIKKIEGFKG